MSEILNASNFSDEDIKSYDPKTIENIDKDVAVLLFTSGTTGFPKPVSYSYKLLLNYHFVSEDYEVSSGKRNLWYSGPCWITHLIWTCQTTMAQATRIFHNKFDTDETSKVIEQYKVFKRLIVIKDNVKTDNMS